MNSWGCILSPTDLRDYTLKRSTVDREVLPEEFRLVYSHYIKHQGSINSCTAHATSSILEYYNQGHRMSTNFIYGGQNVAYNATGPGMSLRNACKLVTTYGDALEIDCRGNTEVTKVYDIAREAFNNNEIMSRAYEFKTAKYVKLNTINDIKYFIYHYGPCLLSIKWFEDYTYNPSTNTIDSKLSGGYSYHAVMCYGWTDKGLLCQNSWGINWGDKGTFILKYHDNFKEAYGLINCQDGDYSEVVDPTHEIDLLNIIYKFLNKLIAKLFTRK